MIELTVIIPTYNPDFTRFKRVLAALQMQTLAIERWELLIVDNNSDYSLSGIGDLSWHPAARILPEKKQGLTYARMAGFTAARGEFIVLLDDDNLPAADYLEKIIRILNADTRLGAIGGKSLPEFEITPPAWLSEFYASLALRNPGEEIIKNQWENQYPAGAPIGAGMACRMTALQTYMQNILKAQKPVTDRTKHSLSSGGDNEMVIEILKDGWLTAYYPSLVIRHLIPAERIQPDYLARLINQTNRSWIAVLEKHRINPWKKIPRWTLPFRKAKAWWRFKAWQDKSNYIRWKAACGTFDGLSLIDDSPWK